uniref:Uncharacterized protein n=1 Tax=Arundo donax TaxID=35708 RepID=A0A0A9CAI5_ARUDO
MQASAPPRFHFLIL